VKLGIIATQIAKDDATSAFFFDELGSGYASGPEAARQPANDAKDAGRASGIFTRPAPRPRAAKTARRRP
jgi:hypothetical protein